ncbi:sugar-binding transcriptional regulator [Salipaludibacillus agaradhaerens]|nr:sugar-binding transcriptional regulator [Salipaludibacillus agaradhaerens]MCR6118968.1 sugar-binding transcriptional regulator [Salipaludibacillus agaradhaerens]
MSFLEDRRLLVKIAYMYYEEGATQSEIAKTIGFSRSLISKYLTKAKELGVVEIIIHEDEEHPFMGLEAKIERKYDLKEVICVPSSNDSAKSRLGTAAAKYLLRVIKDGKTIGFSSGTTLNEVAKAMPQTTNYSQLLTVPLVGGMGDEQVDIHANSIVARIAEKLNARYKLLHAPVLVDSKEAKDVIINLGVIKNTLDIGRAVDIAVVGIGGTPEHSTMVKSYLDHGNDKGINYNEIVGDICYNFIDSHGKAPSNSWNDRVVALEVNKLKDIPHVIGIASGSNKVKAIQSALNGELLNVLITDEETALALLKS